MLSAASVQCAVPEPLSIGVIFDALLLQGWIGSSLGRRDCPDLRRRFDRQPYRQASAFAFLALDRDRAAMKVDDHLDEVKSHSGPHDPRNVAAVTCLAIKRNDL